MSRENVEIVRAALDAYNRGDRDAALNYAAPDFELDMSRAIGPEQRGIYGLDQARQFWDDLTTEVKNGKTISIRGYLDPKEALEAAGLRE